MYCYNGIVYRIIWVGGIILILGLSLLVASRFWNNPKEHIRVRSAAIFIIIFSAVYMCFHVYKLINPNVVYYEGYFSREYRDSSVAPPLPFTMAYVFSNDDGLKPTFYLDVFTQKDIFTDDLNTQTQYRVYYEKDLKIIVLIEATTD